MTQQQDAERAEKLNALQTLHGELTRKKNALKRRMAADMDEIGKLNKEIKRIGGQIFDLKNIDGETPHVTDHAIVRYLERVKGMNIWDLKAEIMSHKDAVRAENTIVTVNSDKDDPSKEKL